MADDKIKAYDRHGEKIEISKEEIGKLYALGGRVATTTEKAAHLQEEADKAAQAKYDALPTYRKVAGGLTAAAGLATMNPLLIGSGADQTPGLAGYGAGVREGLTMGVADVAARKVADAVGGKAAGDRYAAEVDLQREASPTAYAAGNVAGMLGASAAVPFSAGGVASRVAPGAVAALEGVAGRVAARGVLGRAAVTAAEMAGRGAIEGGIYSGAQYAADEALHDRDLASEKLFAAAGTGALYGLAGGAALGAGGSLAMSGLRAAGRGVTSAARSGLARVLAPAEEASAKVAADVAADGGVSANAGLKRKANEMAFDALGATKVQARDALEHVVGGAEAVGEYVNRIGIGKAAEGNPGLLKGAFRAGMSGRADELLQAIQADKAGRIAEGLSGAIKGVPARVDVRQLAGHAEELYQGMLKDPTKIAGAEAFRSRVMLEASALGNAGRIATDGTIDAADAFYVRSDMAKQAYELGRASGAAGDAYKSYLRQWDATTIKALDEAAEKAGQSGVGDEIRKWKREWQLASAAEKAAEGGAERIAHNNTFGIRESIGGLTAIASGHVFGGLAALGGGKIARERGSAVAAYTLSQLAERGTLSKLVTKVDDQISRASTGLLRGPAKGLPAAAERMPATNQLAKTALVRVAEFQKDPEAFVEKATKQAEAVSTHDPELASAIVQRQVRAMTFLSSKVPQMPDIDPLAPHPAPKMTTNERAELGRYAWYVEKPTRFFAEVARGKLTYEGAEVAQALAPRAFAELQDKTMEALAARLAKGDPIPYRQRLVLGTLLNVAATPAQRPEHAAFLQQNVSGMLPSEQPPPTAPAKPRSVSIPTQRSALDRLEANGPGRR